MVDEARAVVVAGRVHRHQAHRAEQQDGGQQLAVEAGEHASEMEPDRRAPEDRAHGLSPALLAADAGWPGKGTSLARRGGPTGGPDLPSRVSAMSSSLG